MAQYPKWPIGLVTIVFLALLASAQAQTDTRLPITDSRPTPEMSTAVSDQESPIQRPAIGISGPLSVAEIRWCRSQEVGLEAIQPMLGTRDAINRHNELAYEFNRRCSARPYSEADVEEATRLIDSTKAEIVDAAIADILRRNDSELTRRIQELLESMSYEPGTVDGVYGTQTRAAIEAFQQRVGFQADGLLSEKLLGRLQVENMRRLTGRETAPIVNVAVLVMEAPQGAESDTEPVADAQVIVSGDRGFHLEQQTDDRGRIELGRVRAGQIVIDVRRNGEQYRSTFQVTEDPLQEFWITLPAPFSAD